MCPVTGACIDLSRGDRKNLPLLLMSASLIGTRQKDYVSHGNGGTGQEGMLVRGLVCAPAARIVEHVCSPRAASRP
jgi:hypothetical protein